MRASVRNDTTTRVITLEVSGVPDVDASKSWHVKSRTIRPDHVTIRIVDGEVRELKISGPMILKSGELSTNTRESLSWYPAEVRYQNNRVDGAPDWVRTLWSQAPAGVTSWSTEVPA